VSHYKDHIEDLVPNRWNRKKNQPTSMPSYGDLLPLRREVTPGATFDSFRVWLGALEIYGVHIDFEDYRALPIERRLYQPRGIAGKK
jgi:hypothetical protein